MVKLIYIAHQIAGDINGNVKAVSQICKEIHTDNVIPIAPYLVAVQYLNDHVEEERALGISTNKEHFRRKVMDEVWLCGPRISKGMEEEIKLGLKYEIPIKCYNPELQSKLKNIIEKYKKLA